MDPHLVPPGGVVGAVVAPVRPLAQVDGGDVTFDFVLAPERQGAVIAGVGSLPVVDRVHVPTHLKKTQVFSQ